MIGTALEVVKTTTADSEVGLLAGIGQRFLSTVPHNKVTILMLSRT
jgi:hypothetical protein